MKPGKALLLTLTIAYIATELFFIYIFTLRVEEITLFEGIIKMVITLVLILLFSKQHTWAKWALSILLALYGLMCLLLGWQLTPIFYGIGVFDIFFAVYIHTSEDLGIYRVARQPNAEGSGSKLPLNSEGKPYQYPTLSKRYKASLIDSALETITLIIIMLATDDSEWRMPLILLTIASFLFIYEPLLTCYSQTIGKRLMKTRVAKHENPEQRISLPNAYIRSLTKFLLGWISLTTVLFNPHQRAIHDLASGSVVVKK